MIGAAISRCVAPRDAQLVSAGPESNEVERPSFDPGGPSSERPWRDGVPEDHLNPGPSGAKGVHRDGSDVELAVHIVRIAHLCWTEWFGIRRQGRCEDEAGGQGQSRYSPHTDILG